MADTSEALKEIFDELFTLLEHLETRNVAVLEFLREQGGATDEKLAPYLDRAGAASNVKWRAARVRMEYLLAAAPKSATEHENDKKPAATHEQPKDQPKSSDAQGNSSNAEIEKSERKSDSAATEKQAASLAEPVQHLEVKESNDAKNDSTAKGSKQANPQTTQSSDKTPSDKTSTDANASSNSGPANEKQDASPKTQNNNEDNGKTAERSTTASSR